MFKLRDLLDILKFHISKEFINLARISLELLEKSRDNNLKLEKILSQAGFEDQELFKAVEEFQKTQPTGRKDCGNDPKMFGCPCNRLQPEDGLRAGF